MASVSERRAVAGSAASAKDGKHGLTFNLRRQVAVSTLHLDGPFFEGITVRGQVACVEIREGEFPRFARGDLRTSRRFAVVLEEFHDPDAWRQLDQPLLEAKQRVYVAAQLFVIGTRNRSPKSAVELRSI